METNDNLKGRKGYVLFDPFICDTRKMGYGWKMVS
jgi:hypothetical protein